MRYDPGLVLLSILLAALGGHVGFGFARAVREAAGGRRRLLLAAAAGALALGIWTMHFVGMLAAELPAGIGYAVVPTLLSFLVCVLVVGLAVFFVAAVPATLPSLGLAALMMGLGIATMHYLGMSALRGVFCAEHDPLVVAASIAVGVAVSAGALLPFARPLPRLPLAPSGALFGFAVAGLHYTAMAGLVLAPGELCARLATELVLGEQELAIVVALMGFVVAGGFLLYLLPDRPMPMAATAAPAGLALPAPPPALPRASREASPPAASSSPPRPLRVPVRGFDGIRLLAPEQILWVKAEGHYTKVFESGRESFCDWSISQAEAQLAGFGFVRCHRCRLVRVQAIRAIRRAGKGAVLVLAGEPPCEVPVARGRLAALERCLGLRATS